MQKKTVNYLSIHLSFYLGLGLKSISLYLSTYFILSIYLGLEEEGLYRVVGVASKVTKLLNSGLDRRKLEKLNLG